MAARMAVRLAAAMAVCSGWVWACTGVCASAKGLVLVGNNEDYGNPNTRIWFEPGGKGGYGRVLVGFDNGFAQGGMNEKGLFFDGFATPKVARPPSPEKELWFGSLGEKALAECATVEEVVRLFARMVMPDRAVLLFADANGDAVAIEPMAVVRKKDWYFVQTNFYRSMTAAGSETCWRYKRARQMLEDSHGEISVDLVRRILAATHQEGRSPTQYSNIYDLKARVMYLYHFHDFEEVVKIDLAEELKKGARRVEIGSLFRRVRGENAGPRVEAGRDAAATALCAALREDLRHWARAEAAQKLGGIATGQAVGCLVQALADRNADVRRRVRDALVRAGAPTERLLKDRGGGWQERSVLERIRGDGAGRPFAPGKLEACHEPAKEVVSGGRRYPIYPALLDSPPRVESPWRAADGREYVVVVTKEGKFGLADATIEDCEPKGRQLLVDGEDFPALSRTGVHAEPELDRTTRATGRMVEEINDLAQPGGLSTDGFLAEGEDLLSVMRRDNRLVREMGLKHRELAHPLMHVWNLILADCEAGRWNMAKHRWEVVQALLYRNKKVLVTAGDTKGGQESIFNDGLAGGFHIEMRRQPDAEEEKLLKAKYGRLGKERMEALAGALTRIEMGEIEPFYVMRYGFYEGHTRWRVDPVAIAFIFGLRTLEEIERAFPGRLDEVLALRLGATAAAATRAAFRGEWRD